MITIIFSNIIMLNMSSLKHFYMCILTPFADVKFIIITIVCFDQSSLLEPKTTPIPIAGT